MPDLKTALQCAIVNARITETCELNYVEPQFTYELRDGKPHRVWSVRSTGEPMPERVLSLGGQGAKVKGGHKPVVRDANKAFKIGNVFGMRQHPKTIGASGGERVVVEIRRRPKWG